MSSDSRERLLTEQQLERIREDVFAVLAVLGIEIARSDVLDRLAARSGVKRQGNRLLLAPELVSAELQRLRNRPQAPARGPLSHERILLGVHLATHPVWVIDPETGERVGPGAELYAKMVRFVDSMYDEGVRWGGGYTVEGLPAPWSIKALAATRLDLELSRDGTTMGKEISPPELLHLCMDMHDVMGKPAYHSIWTVSPLRLVGDEFDAAVALIGRRNAYFRIATWSMAGLSAPMPLRAACVETVATGLGCYVILRLLAPEQTLSVNYEAFPALPTHLGKEPGITPTPISSLWEAKAEVFAYFNAPASGNSLPVKPRYRSGGITPDGAFCFATLLADRERADQEEAEEQARKCIPLLFNDACSVVDLVREGVQAGGVFTGLESTARVWRSMYWFPRGNEQLAPGNPRLLEEIERRISHPSWQIEKHNARELDRIYREACQRFGQGYRPGPLA